MSDVPARTTWGSQLAGKWQVPLLLASAVMLAAGIWRLRPAPVAPDFEALYSKAVALHKAELFPEASSYIEQLRSDPARSAAEKRRLDLLMAQVIFEHERGNIVHGPGNLAKIIEYSEHPEEKGADLDPAVRVMRATAWEWMHEPEKAIAEYEGAIAEGAARPWELRKRVLDIRRSTGALSEDALLKECGTFVGPEVDDALACWAAEQTVEILARRKKYEEAERFLAAHAERFKGPTQKGGYDYLQALIWYHMGKRSDAERTLRMLRDATTPADPVYAHAGWLLGRILLEEQSPAAALAFFDDVVRQTSPGPYRSASVLGRAECLAALERFPESLSAFNEAIRQATESPYESIIDLGMVRDSTSALSQVLAAGGRQAEAMAYLRIAARLAPPSDNVMQAAYTERLADLALSLGNSMLARASEPKRPDRSSLLQEAQDAFVEAGQHFLRLAKLASVDEPAATAATWNAADAFDVAGERRRTAEVLEAFLRERGESTQAPQALHRLGQTYQAVGDYGAAIERYQQALIRFPRTPAAIASLVPLADCFLALGQPDKAEQTLLRIVDHAPDDPLGLITPAAVQFREAMFKLADLYAKSGEHEKAIARYEEAIERYRDDPRTDRAVFMLAEAYRRSAERIRQDIEDGRNVARKEQLKGLHQARLQRSHELYGKVIERYRGRADGAMGELDRLYLKLSHLYRADAVFDLSKVATAGDERAFAEALEMYDRAAWIYQQDPVSMSAYIQMINCHLRLGRQEKARMVLQRARWALRNIPDEAFASSPPEENRAFWEQYLNWLERTPTLATTRPADAAPPVALGTRP